MSRFRAEQLVWAFALTAGGAAVAVGLALKAIGDAVALPAGRIP